MCILHIKLIQSKYLAEIKGEVAEIQRLNNEIIKHVEKCAECNGMIKKSRPLADQLFGTHVHITGE